MASMPAERLYYADSTLTNFTAIVTDIRERSRSDGASLWQVALDRSAFYPSSGGQPHDTGTLAATAPSGATLEAPILGVEEDEHGEVWHLTQKPVLAGTAVEGRIDWARRLDHMQQHSGQHLLSALFDRELHAPTVSFHLGETISTIDITAESIAPEQLERIERLANAIIAEARPMSARTVSAGEAERLLAAGQVRKLPQRDGDLRLITIPEKGSRVHGSPENGEAALDLNACGGTHVASTSQIGPLLIRGTERVRQGMRVSFVCGDRALAAARADDALLGRLGRDLSVGRSDLAAAIARIQTEARTTAKEQQRLREDLANYHAARLLVEDPPLNNLRVVRRVFADRDADYVKLLAARVTAAAPHTVALLASTQQTPATLVVATGEDLARDANQLLRGALASTGGRGGGSATLAQGQVAIEQLDAMLNGLEEALRR